MDYEREFLDEFKRMYKENDPIDCLSMQYLVRALHEAEEQEKAEKDGKK